MRRSSDFQAFGLGFMSHRLLPARLSVRSDAAPGSTFAKAMPPSTPSWLLLMSRWARKGHALSGREGGTRLCTDEVATEIEAREGRRPVAARLEGHYELGSDLIRKRGCAEAKGVEARCGRRELCDREKTLGGGCVLLLVQGAIAAEVELGDRRRCLLRTEHKRELLRAGGLDLIARKAQLCCGLRLCEHRREHSELLVGDEIVAKVDRGDCLRDH